MDPEDVQQRLEKIHCSGESECRFKFWTSAETYSPSSHNVWLDESVHAAKLACLVDNSKDPKRCPRIVAITTVGDPSAKHSHIHMLPRCILSVMDQLGITSYASHLFTEQIFHLSRHTLYDEQTDKPIALILLLRVPRNSQCIQAIIRIDIASMSTVFFLAASDESIAEGLHRRIATSSPLLLGNPLFVLTFILEQKLAKYWAETEVLKREVNQVETATGMVRPSWRTHLSSESKERLADFNGQLEQLHASHMDLCHQQVIIAYMLDLGGFCFKTCKVLDDLRLELGLAGFSKHQSAKYLEHAEFITSRLKYVQLRVQECIDRLRTQVNVVFSQIAQRDSNINLGVARDSQRVARIAAKDSNVDEDYYGFDPCLSAPVANYVHLECWYL
ncbi:hypothetical protein QBC37DRAFT_385323 [Rhypophila decipiens]|uniref:Uncharacterized protein n=1 Tax=Rhypophila decipiens TaxID=261697 RepID=A0AAN6YBT3_9PEZI|nr:hypothetical protein QBC37DRAFT_385323 [Rhypophila decipiens]